MRRAVHVLGILVAAFTLGACAGGVEADEELGQSGNRLEERQSLPWPQPKEAMACRESET